MYVGGLHPSTTQRNFKNFLSKFGKVKSIDLVKEKGTGNSQGFGFATFKEQEAADLAVSKSGQLKLKGNEVRIYYIILSTFLKIYSCISFLEILNFK